jgi:hypothetical protein
MSDFTERRRFSSILPFYVNETADTADRAFVDDYLRRHPEAEKALRLERLMSAASKVSEPSQEVSDGLSRLMKGWGQEPTLKHQVEPPPGAWRRLASWLQPGGFSPALAIVSIFVVIQAGFLLNLIDSGQGVLGTTGISKDAPHTRGLPGLGSTPGPVLKVTFKATISFAEAAETVQSLNGRIIDGPDEGGAVFVQFDQPSDAATVKARLIESARTDDVEVEGH